MANIKVQYNGSTANYTAPLDTAGKLMASNLTITAEPVLQDKSVTSNGSITADSGYDGLGTVTVAVPSDLNNTDLDVTQTSQVQNYQAPVGYSGIGSITVTAQAATPSFTGGNVSINSSDVDVYLTNNDPDNVNFWEGKIESIGLGIPLKVISNVQVSSDSVTYNNNVNGWVNKSSGAVAMDGNTSTEQTSSLMSIKGVHLDPDVYQDPFTITNTRGASIAIDGIGVDDIRSQELITINDNYLSTDGPIHVTLEGTHVTGDDGHLKSISGFPTPTITQTPVEGGVQVTSSVGLEYDPEVFDGGIWVADATTPVTASVVIPTGSTINNQNMSVTLTQQTDTFTKTDSSKTGIGSITVTAATVTPTFKGGGLSVDNVDISANGTNATVSDTTNTSGIAISIGAEFEISRGSVLYNGNVNGWVNKTNNTVAVADDASQEQSDIKTVYINGVTVPSGKILTVVNNGTTNINGGNIDKGVQVNGHTAIVDTYTVTDSNGDLLVPTYTASTKALSYPSTWTTAGSTATYPSLTGDVETINGLIIKDSTALKGSGTAPTDATYGYYLAKWNTASSLGTGSKVTISTSTPSGGSNGDIWYQVL